MRAVKLWIALFWIAGTLAFGQAVDKSLTFDVASVSQLPSLCRTARQNHDRGSERRPGSRIQAGFAIPS